MRPFNDWFPSSVYGTTHANVKAFGAIGDQNNNLLGTLYGTYAEAVADYPKTTEATWETDSADWCGIQAAIDYALVNNIRNVVMPDGIYKVSDTIHLGYGMLGGAAASNSIELIGAGWTSTSNNSQGTVIGAIYQDRPILNIQGGRQSGVRNICFAGVIAMGSLTNRADASQYIP